jgi:hypothetical protein
VLGVGVRQLIPADLAEIPPGPELARVLAGLEPSRLSGFDCVQVLKAQYRQANHERARVMALMAEVGLCGGVGPAGDELWRRSVPDEFAADEVRAALVLTRRAAEAQLWVAYDLVSRLPQVYAAMLAGVLDEPRARVFSEWTLELSAEQARAVCATLLPQAPRLTTGQLVEQIKKLAIAVDPEWARRRYEQALTERKVVGRRNADGSANLAGYNLPLERVAAASGHIDALAKAAKHAGDARPIDHIRAELFLGMTDGSFTGLDDATIIDLLLTHASGHPDTGPEDRDHPDTADADGGAEDNGAEEPDGEQPGTAGYAGQDSAGQDSDGLGSEGLGSGGADSEGPHADPHSETPPWADECRSQAPDAHTAPLSWAGVELRVRLSTLLGHDRYPAELTGWGPIHAELARDLITTLGTGQWRFAITDEEGHLLHCGITRARPAGIPTRAAHCRAILELQIPVTTLRALAVDPTTLGGWSGVVAELVRRLEKDVPSPGWSKADASRRTPGAALRRWLEARDRTCIMIGCRAPAHHADQDHTLDHTDGGPTTGPNLGALCRHDHRLKGEGGWKLDQPHPGVFQWTSRLGHPYHQHPPQIIEPLLDPIPYDQSPYPLVIPPDDDWEDTHIWEDPHPNQNQTPHQKPTPTVTRRHSDFLRRRFSRAIWVSGGAVLGWLLIARMLTRGLFFTARSLTRFQACTPLCGLGDPLQVQDRLPSRRACQV